MVQKQSKKQLYKLRTFASDKSGVNTSVVSEKAPTLEAEMSKTINEISKLETGDLISSPSKSSSKNIIRENIIDESVVKPVQSDLPVSKSKIDIEISNEDSESATIITDTKKDRFKLFPAISASIQKWFGDYKKNQELKKQPKYTVPETARRKGIIQKATSQTGIGATSDFDNIRERVKQRQEQEETEREKAKIAFPAKKAGEIKTTKSAEVGETDEVLEKTLLKTPITSVPKLEEKISIKYQADEKTTKPSWETAVVKEKEEKASAIWTPKVEPAFPLLEKELAKKLEKPPLQKPTLAFTKAGAISSGVVKNERNEKEEGRENKNSNFKQISSPIIKFNLAKKLSENSVTTIPSPKKEITEAEKGKPVPTTSFRNDFSETKNSLSEKTQLEKPIPSASLEINPAVGVSGLSSVKESESLVKKWTNNEKWTNGEVTPKEIKVSGFSGFERGVSKRADKISSVSEKVETTPAFSSKTNEEEMENLPKREVALQTPKTKNLDYENVVFKEGKIKQSTPLNLFSNLDTNSLALVIAVLIVVISGSWFFISESNRKNQIEIPINSVTVNPHLLNGEFIPKNDQILSKEGLLASIKQELNTSKNNVSYFAFSTEDKLDYIKSSTILLLLDFNLEAGFSQSVSGVFFGSLPNNQPFLIINVTSYNSALGGMLKWENHIYDNLENIFSLEQDVSETFTGFVDATLSGQDVRILKNNLGDEKLVYSIVDKRFVIITTNTTSLGEILTDLND